MIKDCLSRIFIALFIYILSKMSEICKEEYKKGEKWKNKFLDASSKRLKDFWL